MSGLNHGKGTRENLGASAFITIVTVIVVIVASVATPIVGGIFNEEHVAYLVCDRVFYVSLSFLLVELLFYVSQIKKSTNALESKITQEEIVLFPPEGSNRVDALLLETLSSKRAAKIKIICYGTNKYGKIIDKLDSDEFSNIKAEVIIFSHRKTLLNHNNDRELLKNRKKELGNMKNVTVYISKIPPTIRASLILTNNNEPLFCTIQPYSIYPNNESALFDAGKNPSIVAKNENGAILSSLKNVFDKEFQRLKDSSMENEQKIGASISGNAKKYIPQIIIEYLKQNEVNYINSLPINFGATIDDVIAYCAKQERNNCGKNEFNFKKFIEEALAKGYDYRYLNAEETSEQRAVIKRTFIDAFNEILRETNSAPIKNKKVIVTGIGSGVEGKMLYSEIKDLTIVDIAPSSLEQAKKFLPRAKAFCLKADELKDIANDNCDVYISLRTYQSTYFNIPSSLKEVKRVLKNNGTLIISIPCGYLDESGDFREGLNNPHNGELEEDRPERFVELLEKELERLNFYLIETKRIPSEIFVYALNADCEE